jgi:hypothetical protein
MSEKIRRMLFSVVAALAFFVGCPPTRAGQLLVNGNFNATAILGAGQSPLVFPAGNTWTTTAAAGPNYLGSISGVSGWTYATPEHGGTHTDVGLTTRGDVFGSPQSGQALFSNRWDRLVSQTITHTFHAGEVLTATVDFGTFGETGDSGRAGYFYLVAGTVNPQNLDAFASGSILLDSLSVANPRWTQFVPDVVAADRRYTSLRLTYEFRENDPALLLPITFGMRLAGGSLGASYWDNALLTTDPGPNPSPVPEPGTWVLAFGGLVVLAARRLCG